MPEALDEGDRVEERIGGEVEGNVGERIGMEEEFGKTSFEKGCKLEYVGE